MSAAYLIDMDGVLVHGRRLIPGADRFIERLRATGRPFLVLTNNSRHSPAEHAARLTEAGLRIDASEVFTSAIATARFLRQQRPDATAYAIGETGIIAALQAEGITQTERSPDYVVLAETVAYSFEQVATAVRLIMAGARFIATNPDVSGPSEHGIVPGCGAMAAMIQAACGIRPYFVGKPNPLMMREALDQLGVRAADATMIGDRMDTDVVAGTETGMGTILVLSGVTTAEDVHRFAYLPRLIVPSVAEIEV